MGAYFREGLFFFGRGGGLIIGILGDFMKKRVNGLYL